METDVGGFPFLQSRREDTILPENVNQALQSMGEPEGYPFDFCVNRKTRTCLREFFKDSKSNDVLLFSVGYEYAMKLQSRVVDGEAWLRASASSFRSHLAATFQGNVFRVSLAHQHHQEVRMTDPSKRVDDILWGVWQPSSVEEDEQWNTIDQWPINEGRQHLYQDHIHFAGKLTLASLYLMLNKLCPGGGTDSSALDRPSDDALRGKVIAVDEGDLVRGTKDQYYMIGHDMLYLKVLSSSHISCIPKYNQTAVRITPAQLKQMTASELTVLDFCTKDSLIRGSGSRSVYLVRAGQKYSFKGIDDFTRRGYDFADVVGVPMWMVDMLPENPSL